MQLMFVTIVDMVNNLSFWRGSSDKYISPNIYEFTGSLPKINDELHLFYCLFAFVKEHK